MANKVIRDFYKDLKCPVRITKDQLYDYIYKSDFDYRKLKFQLAMLMHEKTKGFILCSLCKNEIDSFLIAGYETDYVSKKKWCIIRYYKESNVFGFEKYAILQMLKLIKKIAKEHKCNFIGIPNTLVSEYPALTYNLKECGFIRSFIPLTKQDNSYETIGLAKEILDKEDELTDEEIMNLIRENRVKEIMNSKIKEEVFVKYNDKAVLDILDKINTLDGRKIKNIEFIKENNM